MNESIPPIIPESPVPNPRLEPPASPELPVHGFAAAVESMLRQPGRILQQLSSSQARGLIVALTGIALAAALLYGFVMGTFAGGAQLWAAPLKFTAGLLLSGLICLPSLYIFSCLGGSAARLHEVAGLLAGLLALVTILLIGFAPVAWVFSQSTESVVAMGVLHLVFFLISMGFGIRFLIQGFTRMAGRSADVLKLWVVVFLLVALQMSTALRPLVGTADTFLPAEKKFFLKHWTDTIQASGSMNRSKDTPHRAPVD